MIEGMKRIGNIMSEVVEYSNMYESYKQVLRGTKRKQSQSGQRIIQDTERILTGLSESLADGSFEISGYKDIDVVEGGKLRHIQVLSLRERIAINAVMRVVDKHLLPRYIRTTSASIVGRGMHDLMKYIRDDIRHDVDGTRYCLKMDIHKFYESIDQDAMMDCVNRVFKDKILICLLDKFVRMMPSGISIGLRSSQCLGNLLLSVVVDHYLKDELGVKYYYRYCEFRKENAGIAEKTVYTGMLDKYFDYKYGVLEYRSVRFETETLDMDNYQGNAVVNYTEREVPYTRIIEHKHFEYGTQPKTVISREYPSEWKLGEEPYYPVNNEKNEEVAGKYRELADKEENVIFGGRLGEYRYYDMDKVIAAALKAVEKEKNN